MQTLVPTAYDQWEYTYALSAEYAILDEDLIFQGEWLHSFFEKRNSRFGYYGRAVYNFDRYSPFVMYDSFKDSENPLFKNTMNWFGTGLGIRMVDYAYFKMEYHYHWLSDADNVVDLMYKRTLEVVNKVAKQNIFRADLIVIF